jgi:hypothetical protein
LGVVLRSTGLVRIDRNIWREDRRDFHGYRVMVKRRGRRDGVSISDTSCGGRRAAERQAYAERARRETSPPVKLKRRNANNTSGSIGVSVSRERTRAGRRIRRWSATWPLIPGGVRKKSFSAGRYGETEARRLASGFRRRGIRE